MNHGPYKSYINNGLETSMTDLYEFLQTNINSNIDATLQSIIVSPGLKIQSDEFSSYVLGNTLYVQSGSVVFNDYSIYISGASTTNVTLTLPSVSYEHAYLFVVAEDETSHPYPVKGSADTNSVTLRNISFELRSNQAISREEISYQIAHIYIESGGWVVEDLRYDHILKLSGSSQVSSSGGIEPGQPIAAVISTNTLYHSRKSEDGEYTFDKSSYQYDVGYGAIINARWVSEVYAGTMRDPTYYKIELRPCTYAYDTIQSTILDDGSEENVRISIPASMFTEYDVYIYRICDPTEQIVEDPNFSDSIIAGVNNESALTPDPHTTLVGQIGLGKGIRIYVDGQLGDAYTYQIFINENGVAMANTHALAYEGIYRQYVYFPSDDVSSISILTRFVLRRNGAVVSENTISTSVGARDSELYVLETPVQFVASSIDPGAGVATTHTIMSNMTLFEDMVINRVSCSLGQGAGNADIQAGEQLWEQPLIMGTGGYVRVRGAGGTTYISMPYSVQGYGWFSPSTPIVIPAGEVITISTIASDIIHPSNPLGLHIILYTVGGWQEV